MRFKNNKSKTELNIYYDGYQFWNQNVKVHRINGPAIICPDGHREWFKNAGYHRTDGPAVICADGTEYWYKNNKKIK